MSERLDGLAGRVADDRFFLASALADYARGERLDDAGLAGVLGCAIDDLTALRLCRRPVGDAATFRAIIAQIAAYCGVDRAALAAIVRRADALDSLRADTATGAGDGRGTLLAAREREGDAADEGQADPDDAGGRR